MGNPRITYGNAGIDLVMGKTGLKHIPKQKQNRNESASGKIETINLFGRYDYKFDAYFSRAIYHALLAWWSYARQGQSFAFTTDHTKMASTTLNTVVATGEKVIPVTITPKITGTNLVSNGSEWIGGPPPTGWTESNSTLFQEPNNKYGNCLRVGAILNDGAAANIMTVLAGDLYCWSFNYRNVSGDVARSGIYDSSNAAWINSLDLSGRADLADSINWSSLQEYFFECPAGCISLRIFPGCKLAGDICFYDEVQLYKSIGSNGGFVANTTGWTAGSSALLASVAGGKSGNCLRITENGTATPHAYQLQDVIAGKLYKLRAFVKAGTEATYRTRMLDVTNGNAVIWDIGNLEETAGDWSTEVERVIRAPTGCAEIRAELWQAAVPASGTNIYYDAFSFFEVDPYFAADDYCLLKSTDDNEIIEIDYIDVDSSDVVEIHTKDSILNNYAAGDTLRHKDYFPSVLTTEKDFDPSLTGVIDKVLKYYKHKFEFTENL